MMLRRGDSVLFRDGSAFELPSMPLVRFYVGRVMRVLQGGDAVMVCRAQDYGPAVSWANMTFASTMPIDSKFLIREDMADMDEPTVAAITASLKTWVEWCRIEQFVAAMGGDFAEGESKEYRRGVRDTARKAESMLGVLMWEQGVDVRGVKKAGAS